MNKLLIHEFGELKLDENGTWFHDDIPFVHEGMAKLFNKSIIKENGSYYLEIGNSKAPIKIEDVSIWINDIDIKHDEHRIVFYLSNDLDYIVANDIDLYLENDTKLYCYINEEKARFSKKSFNILTEFLHEDKSGYYIKIGNLRFNIIKT